MDDPRKKYEKPVLNGLGDRDGQLTDQELGAVTGGGACGSGQRADGAGGCGTGLYADGADCTHGGYVGPNANCRHGKQAKLECQAGSIASVQFNSDGTIGSY